MSITTRAPYGFELEAMPLEAFGGVSGHKLTPIAASMMQIQPQGGSVRRIIAPVIAVAAAVAAPYLVPALAGAIAGSIGLAAATTATTVAAGALYGATAAAASAAIGGGNIGRSALIGGAVGGIGAGIGAGLGGGESGGVPFGELGGQGLTEGATTAAGVVGVEGATAVPGEGVTTTISDVSLPAAAPTVEVPTGLEGGYGYDFEAFAPTGAGGAGAPADLGATLSTAPTTVTPQVQTVDVTGVQPTPQVGLNTAGAAPTGGTSQIPFEELGGQGIPSQAPKPGWGEAFGTALVNRATDPRIAAEAVLRAAGQLAGSSIAGSGLSPQQQELVDMQMGELKQLQQQNTQAFNQRLEAAQAILGEVPYFDPEYFGLQRARQQQIAGGQAKSAGLRGLTGEKRRAEERRYDLATGRAVGTAYDQGYLTGLQGRMQTRQAGLNAMPMPNQFTTAYSTPANILGAAEAQRMKQAEATGEMFGDVFGYSKSRSTGNKANA